MKSKRAITRKLNEIRKEWTLSNTGRAKINYQMKILEWVLED